MLKQRILTALVLAPLSIAAIFHLSLDYFSALLVAVMAIGAWEWGPLMGLLSKGRRLAFVATNLLLIAAIWHYYPPSTIWLTGDMPNVKIPHKSVVYLLWLAVAWWVLSAVLTFLYPRYSTFWSSHRSIKGIFGWLTLVPTWLAFMVIRSSEYSTDTYHGAQLLMFLFLMVWSADVGAYFVGKSLGKHKLLPNVSPGKTLEGFIGEIGRAHV